MGEESSTRHLPILQALADSSQRLLSGRGWANERDQILADLGEAAGVDRTYFFRARSPRPWDGLSPMIMDQEAEWCADSIESELDNEDFQGIDIRVAGPRCGQLLSQGKPYVINRREEMSDEERALFIPQAIHGVVTYPVKHEESLLGFVGFDICNPDFPGWTDGLLSALGTAAGLIASALVQEARQKWREQALSMGQIVEESLHEIYVIDLETCQFLQVNRGARQNLGFEAEELRQMTPMDIKPGLSEELFREMISPLRCGGRSLVQFTTTHQRADGTEYPIELYLHCIGDERDLLIAMGVDITERRKRQTEQQALIQELQQARRLQSTGQLAGGIAHDFNNLLTIIMANAEILRELCTSEDQLSSVESIYKATLRGQDLTQRLLAFAQRAPLAAHPTVFDQLFDDLTPLLGRTVPENIELLDEIAPDLWHPIVDPTFLENALLNLILNAAEAMPDGGRVTIRATNRRIDDSQTVVNALGERLPVGRYVTITVSDEGAGIAPEELSRVLEPFYSNKEKTYSSGLGLAMVQGFVLQSGGFLTLESDVDQGTSVHMVLPAAPTKESGPKSLQHREKQTGEGPEARVLLVEDNEMVRSALTHLLEQMAFRVDAVADGDSAWEVIRQQGERWDLVITDVVMPGDLQGPALAELITDHRPDLPVLIMTGYADRYDQPMLQKPISRERLRTAIEQVLEI